MNLKIIFLIISLMFLCLCGCSSEAVSLTELPDPTLSVDKFFEHLKNEEYVEADSMVYNYVTLGMTPAEEIDDPLISAFCRELNCRRSVSVAEAPKITGKTAVMAIQVTTIDLRKIYDPLAANVTDTIYDMRFRGEDVSTDEEIASVTLDELNKLIEENDSLKTTETFSVEFIYVGGEWLLIISDELYSSLIGYSV